LVPDRAARRLGAGCVSQPTFESVRTAESVYGALLCGFAGGRR
jgi:hypothetical protein